MPFGGVNDVGPGNRVLDGRAHWCHLANTVERLCTVAMNGSATSGGDAVCSQIILWTVLLDRGGFCDCMFR